MKAADCDILIVPGLHDSGEGHWQSRWQARLKSARRVGPSDYGDPHLEDFVAAILGAIRTATKPVVLVAHSLGVIACVHAAMRLNGEGLADKVLAGFFVSPTNPARPDAPEAVARFAPVPTHPLPFPALVIASRTDPHCTYEKADDFAHGWGALLIDAGESGHINVDSGHGPWPEGSMTFAGFLSKLEPRRG